MRGDESSQHVGVSLEYNALVSRTRETTTGDEV